MSNEGVAAVERALAVLDCFRIGSERLSLAQISEQVNLHKTTVFRLLNSLCRSGYVAKSTDGSYTLGARVLYLARVYEKGFQLADVVMATLRALSVKTGESAAYYVASGDDGNRLCLFRYQPTEGLHSQVVAGSVMKPDESSTGRVFQTWFAPRPRSPEPLPYFSCGARDPYTSSWCVPVLGSDDVFVGALTVAGPSVRIQQKDALHMKALIMEAARELSTNLGASAELRDAVYGTPA